MGSMTFLLPNPVPPAAEALLRQACFAGGYDQTPSPTQVQIAGDRLVVSRGSNESAYLFLPWPVGANGVMVTATSTLRERAEPYNLLLELARGKLNQVRIQTAEWQEIGLATPADYDRELRETSRRFGEAVLNQPSSAADAASIRVLDQSYQLADRLARLYIEQMFATREEEEGKLPTRLTARYTSPPAGIATQEYGHAFNAARIGFRWRDVEPVESQYDWEGVEAAVAYARITGRPITFGPVIDLSAGMLPAWAAGWDGDLQTLAAFMCDYLETLIGRFRNHIRRWVVCAGFNQSDCLGLTDDERFRLVQRLLEAALQLDPELELVLSIAQPWGDYLAGSDQTISPLTFADDLIRSGVRLSGIELEFRNATTPRGSLPRDLLDASRALDMFSLLGLPIEVLLSHPASTKPDPPASEHQEAIWTPAWRNGPTPEEQADWGASLAALALCKPQVRAVTWDHWTDADPHLTPNGGLVDSAGQPCPLLTRLQAIRTDHLE